MLANSTLSSMGATGLEVHCNNQHSTPTLSTGGIVS